MNYGKMITSVLLVSILFAACGGGDGGSNPGGSQGTPASGVYAKLIVGRVVNALVPTMKTDAIEAIFSTIYDPCATTSDLQPTLVTCNTYTLPWNSSQRRFEYKEPMNLSGFLIPGDNYQFTVTASSQVPALTDSIIFPATKPTITAPGNGGTVSKSGFTISWSGSAGSGTVQIILLNIMDAAQNVTVEPSDTGSYTFNAAQLSGLSAGAYYLQLEKYSEHTITATGYDSRSVIRARHMYSSMITLQ
jgi:hypothetical protein